MTRQNAVLSSSAQHEMTPEFSGEWETEMSKLERNFLTPCFQMASDALCLEIKKRLFCIFASINILVLAYT